MKRFIFLSVIIFVLRSAVVSQSIKVGDTLQNLEFANVLNYKNSSLRLSDFNRKLIILDFWGPTCLSCLESFPKLDSLQKKFNDKLQIIMVNKEGFDTTRSFFQRRKKIKLPAIPFITQDKILEKLFPHNGDPFLVWIDSNRVRFMTDGTEATANNIQKILDKVKFIPSSYGGVLPHIRSLIDEKFDSRLLYYSYLSRCVKEISVGSNIGKESASLAFNCVSITELYKAAYGEAGKYDFNKPGGLELSVSDETKYTRPKYSDMFGTWRDEHSYTYQLVVPQRIAKLRYKIMQTDLAKNFELEATVRKKNVKCFVLIRTSKEDKLKTKGGTPVDNFYQISITETRNDSLRYVRNKPFSQFSSVLESIISYSISRRFIDATGYKGNIDIIINGNTIDSMDINELRSELRRYDLDLVEKKYLLDVLVIKEK